MAVTPGSSRRRGRSPPVTVSRSADRRPSRRRAGGPTSPPTPTQTRPAQGSLARVATRVRRWRGPEASDPPTELARRRAIVERRLADLSPPADAHGRLLVVLEHAAQRIETPDGPRRMNAYLGPIVDRLRGTALDPIEVEIRTRLDDDAAWDRLTAPGSERTLPADVIWSMPAGGTTEDRTARAEAAAAAIDAGAAPLVAFGVDLGPVLGARVAGLTRASFAGQIRNVGRLRSLLARLRPTAVLLADEYHRQEWLTAARLEGVPTVAVQHGMIYRWHTGYMHADRPPVLRLADRTYVFGDWERRMLTDVSVYRSDEVRVSGSPRLDLVAPVSSAEPGPATEDDRASVRAELGIEPADRLVIISGTWGPIYRRFHYPIALAALVDRPLPGVHLVVKLHPGEPDEGPYRAVIEGAARSRGFAPPPVTIVQSVDLYRLLRAADAHVGVQSTVLTEAVATGTLNLLADTVSAADLLGYVDAGVAIPVRDGGDLLAALDKGPGPSSAGHSSTTAGSASWMTDFRPGSASTRIADVGCVAGMTDATPFLIPARGGPSQRVPGKNAVLIPSEASRFRRRTAQRRMPRGRAAAPADRQVGRTESCAARTIRRSRRLARAWGAETPFERPAALATSGRDVGRRRPPRLRGTGGCWCVDSGRSSCCSRRRP